ncbi:MAG: hypothetical protein FRX48_00298 [Lasallia pustulata]|uniref:Uncharacterized protein n=1 Tax=Lasallia pustulata TaxID=136370 RepID=A0A5M8Q1J1_9LECA|nr:MAG: hypothetical protein FRX48_00298 [Lasallia pustulata]
MKKYKMKSGVRLKLLRRTLRERRVLAQYVREVKAPCLQSETIARRRETIDLVASIVMACPNLERLVGFYPIYDHEFDRLTHALSTRKRLKEHVWIIGENDAVTQRSHRQLPPGLMDMEQVGNFLHFHEAWTSLTTLLIHSHNRGVLEHDVFIDVFNRLPSLRDLCISGFDADDFNDATLQALPALRSLRLQALPGISDQGLWRFASAPTTCGMRCLSLVDLGIVSLLVVSKLLAHMTDLRRFTLVQESPLELPVGTLIFQPVLASSLEYMHWDIRAPGTANASLASSIRAAGFPKLRTLRAPSDHDGVLQAVCRPRAQIVLPSDKYSTAHRNAMTDDRGNLDRTLFAARKLAQERLEEARKTVQFKVVVDEGGVVMQIYDFNGFVGTTGSKITYTLKPDIPGSDDAVIDVSDVTNNSKEANVKDGCTGLWNASHPAGKKWWNHSERFRYRPVDLQTFF